MKYLKHILLACLVYGLSTLPVVAATIDEVEPNETTGQADTQVLPSEASIQVNGLLSASDLDVYALDVQASDVLTFDIDCGQSCGQSVDSKITLFDSSDMTVIWQSNDDGGVVDEGSNSPVDPLIQNVSLGKAGRIYILVSHWDTTIGVDPVTASFGESSGTPGDYQLIITGASAAPTGGGEVPGGEVPGGEVPEAEVPETDTGEQVVNINIKPFFKGRWPRINPKARGALPVAILSQENFDPTDVNQDSLRFGATGDEDSLIRCREARRDVNRDGGADLLCFFSMRNAGFDEQSESGTLTGSLNDGTVFTSQAPLKMVPNKGHRHGNRDRRGNHFGWRNRR